MAGALGMAVASRMADWTAWAGPISIGAAGAVLAVLYGVTRWRGGGPTDRAAALADAAAGGNGELRSAFWFSSHEPRPAPDGWTRYHVERAAGRFAGVAWTAVYPRPAISRAVAASCVLALAAALAAVSTRTEGVPRVLAPGDLMDVLKAVAGDEALSAEEREELLARLAEMDAALAPGDMRELSEWLDEAVRNDPVLQERINALLAQLTPEQRAALEQASSRAPADGAATESTVDAAGERQRQAAEWALDDLASRLASQPPDRSDAPPQGAAGEQPTPGLGEADPSAKGQRPSLQGPVSESRQMAASMGASRMMAGTQTGSASGGGTGRSSGELASSQPIQLPAALSTEVIEANADAGGRNVRSDEQRREAEQASSGMRYTNAVAVPSDRAHAEPPPRVPDARRPLLEGYFTRK
jgi:hypothetical protein